MQKFLCANAVSISQFKASPNALVAAAGDAPFAVTSHGVARFYVVPAVLYEAMIERLRDHAAVQTGPRECPRCDGRGVRWNQAAEAVTECVRCKGDKLQAQGPSPRAPTPPK